jgi:amino acid transporter
MAQIPKKFGTFAGVFTPSILTILGVIMYMRLGWVVGQAGIIGAIAVILIAHVISLTTGLSISSIATDKKIRTGGIYYLLSRSLGLPMGGAIGIALFIGTALSISLYIIGFGENFLGIESIRDFLGLSADVTGYRILGTAVIIVLVIIGLISTSLAIKAQFIILGAIVLSLVSVFLGFFLNVDLNSESTNLIAASDGVPLEVVFAIFFPAVTGFTAGIAMSGDLKDPRRSIPRGTMTSIIVGLIVYLALAISIGIFIDKELLLTDNNFLMKIAWFAPLVIAGIWGATLSSALGGILGGPRILQAMSSDRITPKIFARGSGINNEPRNALIFTFLIAEGGILIGDLDAIARLVSMFFLAAYGFINLAFALEKWASADFRPDFKVSKWIGIVGFIASFTVMFKLDTFAMVIAFIAIGGIYFFLQRKQLRHEFGDVWQSVKTNIVRRTLHDLDKTKIEQRNWRPNIILFSGSIGARPHLIDIGKSLVGRHGFLSVFEIVEHKDTKIRLARHQQAIITDESLQHEGIFTRKFAYHDLYEGIEIIAGTYGFSGIEPNTVLMGWARKKKDPERFMSMLTHLDQLDMNIIMIDYNKKVGFGKKLLIDIWWRKNEPNAILSLILARYLMLSDDWRNAKLRILTTSDHREERSIIYQNTRSALNNMRIQAEIRIIDKESSAKSFYEIIKNESVHSDLVVLGVSDTEKGKEQEFIDNVNMLCAELGSVALLKASSYFKGLQIGFKQPIVFRELQKKSTELQDIESDQLLLPGKPELDTRLRKLNLSINELNNRFLNEHLQKALQCQKDIFDNITELIHKAFRNTASRVEDLDRNHQLTTIFIFRNMLLGLRKYIKDFRDEDIKIQKDLLFTGIANYHEGIESLLQESPEIIYQYLTADDLKPYKKDPTDLRSFKARNRVILKLRRKPIPYKIRFRNLLSSNIPMEMEKAIDEILTKWENYNHELIIKTERLIDALTGAFEKIELQINQNKITPGSVSSELSAIEQRLKEIQTSQSTFSDTSTLILKQLTPRLIRDLIYDLKPLNTNHHIRKKPSNKRASIKLHRELILKPGIWSQNQVSFLNKIIINTQLISFKNILRSALGDVSSEIHHVIDKYLNPEKEILTKQTKELLNNYDETINFDFKFNPETEKMGNMINQVLDRSLQKISTGISRLPETVSLIDKNSLRDYQTGITSLITIYEVSLRLFINYLVQNEFTTRIRSMISNIENEIQTVFTKLQDVSKNIILTQQTMYSEEVGLSALSVEEKKNIIAEQLEIIGGLDERIDQITQNCDKLVFDLNNEAENKINLHSIEENLSNQKRYIRGDGIRKETSKFKSGVQKFQLDISNMANQFWYRQSKGFIFARRLIYSEVRPENIIASLHNLIEKVSIQTGVQKKLPFYYQQLFLRKQSYLNEFWVERDRETQDAVKTIERFNSGYSGALMIHGEEDSGKTFFCYYIAGNLFDEPNIIRLNAPPGGSIDPKVFIEVLQKATGIKGSVKQIFNRIPKNSVLIINNFELWWEKSRDGLQVLELIKKMISNHSKQCFMIFNTNTSSFSFINKMMNIETSFLNIIELEPFHAEQLKDLIMKRHLSGNLTFKYGSRNEDRFRSYDYAKLFSRYFTFTKGNPGTTLRSWIANITEVEQDAINIKAPKTPTLDILDHIETDWYILILQFVLHKRLTIKRLERITKETKEKLSERITQLVQAGLVNEYTEDVYEINEFIYPYLKDKLIEKEML